MWLYEDNHLLALSKPVGLLSQSDSTGKPDVVSLAKEYIKEKYNKPGNVFIGLVHRLDRPSSGAMILARTSKAARRLSQAFRHRQITKKYMAVVEGNLSGSGMMEDYLVKEADRAHIRQGGKYASLKWESVKSVGNFTVVEIKLITGRAHQIRCQFSHRGYPIMGDIRYGARHTVCESEGIALHCAHLGFQHPVQNREIAIEAVTPESWNQFQNDQFTM
ncbi:MAG: RluA family pseudouridine synthase [Bacteroidetes bacterium]|nr:RluA family pseudouridine synthase [Bacteroidota bacterium]MCY4233772.1 RluA family pseudouridine synthase [Bacteroidota bacterium]